MAQSMRPISTVTDEGNFTGGTAHGSVDGTAPDTGDYWNGNDNQDDVLEVLLTDLSASEPGTGTCTVSIYETVSDTDSAPAAGGGSVTYDLEVYEGATQRATRTGITPTDSTFTLDNALTFAASAITDWSDVRVRFTSYGTGGSPAGRRGAAVSYIDISTPDTSADVEVTTTAPQALILTENTATLAHDVNITTTAPQALILTEQTATVAFDVNVTTTAPQALSLSEQTATIAHDVDLTTTAPQALSLTEQTADITHDVSLTTTAPQALSLTEQTASISYGVNVTTTAPQALTLTEQTATLVHDVAITTGVPQALTLTENTATLTHDVGITAGVQALTLTEQTADIALDVNVSAGSPQALSIATYAATVEIGSGDVDINTNPQALTLTEYAATIAGGTREGISADCLTPMGTPGTGYDDFGLRSSGVTVELVGNYANLNYTNLSVKRVIPAYSDLGPSGRPIGLYSFDNTLTVELTGTAGSGQNGALTITSDVLEVLTTQLATSSLGSITAAIPKDVALTTQLGTSALGTVTPQYAWTQTLDAVEGTATVGAIELGVTLTSLVGTTTLGTLSLTTDVNETLDAAVGTGTIGTAAALTDQFIDITGHAGTTTLGTVSVSVPAVTRDLYSDLSPMGTPGVVYTFVDAEGASAEITGVEATGAVAVFDAWTVQQTLDAVSATASTNDVTTTQGNTTDLTTVVGTTALGTLVIPETVALTGTFATAQLGGITVDANDVSVELGGFELSSGLGSITLSVDSVVSVTGVSSTGEIGLIINPTVVLTGVESTVSVGTVVTPNVTTTLDLTGVAGTMSVGTLATELDIGTPIENAGATSAPSNYEQCDISGFRVLPGDLHRNSNGRYTRRRSIDPQHPMDKLRSIPQRHRGSRRPEPADRFLADNEVQAADL